MFYGGSAWDNVEHLAPLGVDDAARPSLGAEAAPAAEHGLVESSASVSAMRAVSASSSAAPQRRTAALTVCQSQPSTAAVSPIGSPRPARLVGVLWVVVCFDGLIVAGRRDGG